MERWRVFDDSEYTANVVLRMIYLIRLRPFTIKDVAIARLSRPFEQKVAKDAKQYKNLIQPFENNNLVIDLDEERELWFLDKVVQTHPEYMRDFEHVLIDPKPGIIPSDVYKSIRNRDETIPTLCAVTIIDGAVRDLHRIDDHRHLFKVLYQAANRDWVDRETSRKLLGALPNDNAGKTGVV